MKAKDLIAYAENRGWRFLRYGARASHRIYRHPEYDYLLAIPDHGSKDLARGTVALILKQIDGTWRRKLKKYAILLERADDGGWSAIAPDLPGLLLAADSREELLKVAPAAIADHLDALRDEGLPMPEPAELAFVEVSA